MMDTPRRDLRHAVFISFRSDDGGYAAAQIDGKLREIFGDRHIFRSAHAIPVGAAFPDELLAALRQACVMVAVIGPRWATIAGPGGRPRLEDPDDWVRREIEYGLTAKIPLIPVLLDGAERPSPGTLPPSIAGIAERQTIYFRSRFESSDLRHLVDALRETVPELSANRLFATPEPAPPGSVAALLLPEYGVVPFTGRATELAALNDWINGPDRLSIALLTGPGGVGKTRLAEELAAEMSAQGWWAGKLSAHGTVADARRLCRLDGDILLIADEAEGHSGRIADIVAALVDERRTAVVRVLVVARSRGRWLDDLTEHLNHHVAESAARLFHLDLSPDVSDTAAEHRRASAAFARRLELSALAPDTEPAGDLEPVPDVRPVPGSAPGDAAARLAVHVRALTNLIDGFGARPALHPLTRLLQLEARYWRQSAASYDLVNPFRDRLDAVVLAATIFGGHDAAQFDRTLALLPEFSGEPGHVVARYRAWVLGMYPSQDRLVPAALRPDILGEEHAAQALRTRGGLLTAIVPHLAGYQRRQALTVLSRAATRHPHLHDALVELLAVDPPRMLTLAVVAIRHLDQPEALDRAAAEVLSTYGDIDLTVKLAWLGLGLESHRHPRLAAVLEAGVNTKLDRAWAAQGRRGYLDMGKALGWMTPTRLDDQLHSVCVVALMTLRRRRFGEALRLASGYTHLVTRPAAPLSITSASGSVPQESWPAPPPNTIARLREALHDGDLAVHREMARLLAIAAVCRLALGHASAAAVDAQAGVALMRRLVDAHPRGTRSSPTPMGAVGLTPQEGAGIVAVALAEDLRDCLTVAARALAEAGRTDLAEAAAAEARQIDRELSYLIVEAECTSEDAMRLLLDREVPLLTIALFRERRLTVVSAGLL